MYFILGVRKVIIIAAALIAAVIWGCVTFFRPQTESVSGKEATELPVIMYHGLSEDKQLQNRYKIPPEYFEQDLKYLKENGYHTILLSELVEHFRSGASLPEKPVLLTFDDGYYDNYVYAFPLLKKYGMKAVISPIASAADAAEKEEYRSVRWSQCTWEQYGEMTGSGLVELQNHSYELHELSDGVQGLQKRAGENETEYEKRISEDLTAAARRIKEKTGYYPQAVVYPFGAKSEGTEKIIRSLGYKAAMDCEEKINYLSSEDDLFSLHRFLRPENISSESFFEKLGM